MFLGQRSRACRKQCGLSQERLGDRSGLSDKLIGEVERAEKSIWIDRTGSRRVALTLGHLWAKAPARSIDTAHRPDANVDPRNSPTK